MTRTICLLACVLLLGGCQDRPTPSRQPAGLISEGIKAQTREAFTMAVLGKTPEEVIAAVGKPDATREGGSSTDWYYHERTVDGITGKVDRSAMVVFEAGKVVRVHY